MATLWRTNMVWDRSGTLLDDVIVNVHHWRDALDNGPEDLATAIVGWWSGMGAGSLRSYIPTAQTLREIRVYNVESVQPDPEHIEPSGVAGLASGSIMPPQIAATTTYEVAQRRHWGRSYWGQLAAVAFAANGRLLDATCDNLLTSVQGLAAAGDLAGYALSIRERGGVPLDAPLVTGFRVDNVADVQRRRRYESVTYRAQS